MKRSMRKTLELFRSCEIKDTDPVMEMLRFLDVDEMQKRIISLWKNGMLTTDLHLTDKGRNAVKVVMCGGVFDIIHHGHIYTLNAAKRLGDILVVVVASDSTAKKGGKTTRHDAKTRQTVVGSVSMVDACLIGHDSDIFTSVKAIRPDIIALGYDQSHHGGEIRRGCLRLGMKPEIVRLESPVPDVSSSEIKNTVSMNET